MPDVTPTPANDPTTFQTPDPLVTTESIAALATSAIAALVVLFKLNISDAQQAAAVTLILTAATVGLFLHGAITRKGRALGNAKK